MSLIRPLVSLFYSFLHLLIFSLNGTDVYYLKLHVANGTRMSEKFLGNEMFHAFVSHCAELKGLCSDA